MHTDAVFAAVFGAVYCAYSCSFVKKLVFSMVAAICKFGIIIILPNNSWLLWCFRSVKLVVYPVHAQCMQRHAAMPIGAWARGQSSTARASAWCVFRLTFPGVPLPPSPPGWRKNGAALRRQPMRYDTQPFETSRQTSSRSTQAQPATFSTSLQSRTSFQRYFIHFLGGRAFSFFDV